MPWCDSCDKYLTPNSLSEEGACPTCDTPADTQDMAAAVQPTTKAPWHFWVMVVALVLYLGWRLIVGGIWLVEQI